MFANTLSSTAMFPTRHHRSNSSLSCCSSSVAYSSQHFTQSDTEAENEKMYMQRRAIRQQHNNNQQRKVLTPNVTIMNGHGTEAMEDAISRRRRQQQRGCRGGRGGDMEMGRGGIVPSTLATAAPFASCSTPKSSQEDMMMLLDNTSVYFRPLKTPPVARRYGRREQQQRASTRQVAKKQQIAEHEQQKQKLISDFYTQTRRWNPMMMAQPAAAIVTECKTPQPMRKRAKARHSPLELAGRLSRRRHRSNSSSNALLMFFQQADADDDVQRCSQPIQLDFRTDADVAVEQSELEQQQTMRRRRRRNDAGTATEENAFLQADHCWQHNTNIPIYSMPTQHPCDDGKKHRPKETRNALDSIIDPSLAHQQEQQQAYTNLLAFQSAQMPQMPYHCAPTKLPQLTTALISRSCSGDSGLEEQRTTQEEDNWDKQTQFVNLSANEKIYENLPPAAVLLEPPMLPSRPVPPVPRLPHRLATNSNQIMSPPSIMQMSEDFPALYGRLAVVALWDARNGNGKTTRSGNASCGMPATTTSPPPTSAATLLSVVGARRIKCAQRQMAELVGIRLIKSVELSMLDSDENFRRKSAEFGAQLAQRLRLTEANSRKEFNWQVKKLQKILHELRTATDVGNDLAGGGPLQKLLRRVFNWK